MLTPTQRSTYFGTFCPVPAAAQFLKYQLRCTASSVLYFARQPRQRSWCTAGQPLQGTIGNSSIAGEPPPRSRNCAGVTSPQRRAARTATWSGANAVQTTREQLQGRKPPPPFAVELLHRGSDCQGAVPAQYSCCGGITLFTLEHPAVRSSPGSTSCDPDAEEEEEEEEDDTAGGRCSLEHIFGCAIAGCVRGQQF